MNLHEYQGKQLFAEYGLPVSKGIACDTPKDAVAAADEIGGDAWVVKAQVHAGGRGKAGGVKLVKSKDDIRAFAQDLADQHGLHVRDGKMVIELATTDSDKGVGLRAIMGDPPFAGGTPVFLGDDTTDEDGFRAAQELGGFGVLVGEPRETAARYRLPGVEAVHQWLELA